MSGLNCGNSIRMCKLEGGCSSVVVLCCGVCQLRVVVYFVNFHMT
jgi:hypothetical protein